MTTFDANMLFLFSHQKSEAYKLVADSARSPLENIHLSEQVEALHRALSQLNDRHRVALVLYNFQGLSYREIAKIQNCSLSAVETRIHRARLKLAELMKDNFSD